MADGTKIEWTDATWNPITGCRVVSPGCTNCYAMKLAGTRLRNHPSRAGLTKDTKAGPVWNGEVRFNRQWLLQPLQWKNPRMIFVCAHGDLFAEGVPDEWIDEIFAVMALSPQHTFQVLTKRPERMREYLTRQAGGGRQDVRNHLAWEVTGSVMNAWYPRWKEEPITGAHRKLAIGAFASWPLPNVWLGVSVEDQKRADDRIPILLETPAAIRWISAEPLLGPIDWKRWLPDGRKARRPSGENFIAPHFFMTKCDRCGWIGSSGLCEVDKFDDDSDVYCANCKQTFDCPEIPRLDWVVAGGESGSNARPMHPHWAYALRDQCAISNTAFLFKQWGNWAIASAENGHHERDMTRNDAIWLDIDGRQAKPNCEGMSEPIGMFRVTKARAGRLLQGIEHDGFPEARS